MNIPPRILYLIASLLQAIAEHLRSIAQEHSTPTPDLESRISLPQELGKCQHCPAKAICHCFGKTHHDPTEKWHKHCGNHRPHKCPQQPRLPWTHTRSSGFLSICTTKSDNFSSLILLGDFSAQTTSHPQADLFVSSKNSDHRFNTQSNTKIKEHKPNREILWPEKKQQNSDHKLPTSKSNFTLQQILSKGPRKSPKILKKVSITNNLGHNDWIIVVPYSRGK